MDSRALKVFNRSDIGTSPNFDNPGVNGLFEIRNSSETTGETGTKPFNGFGPFFTAKTPDNIAMFQIAGSGNQWYIRGKQAANVTLSGVSWSRIYTTDYKPTAADVGAATSGHTHATSIATSSGTNQITLALGTKYAITAGGTSYVFTMPANPNTDIKQNITLKTTTKGYITAVETAPTGTAAAQAGIADTGVYLTTTAGQINATSYKVAETALISYNTTTGCIEITT